MFHWAVGDQLPILEVALQNNDGLPTDLTSATSVTFQMWGRRGVYKVNDEMDVATPRTSGGVTYAWSATDLDTRGVYNARIVVTYIDGRKQSFTLDPIQVTDS